MVLKVYKKNGKKHLINTFGILCLLTFTSSMLFSQEVHLSYNLFGEKYQKKHDSISVRFFIENDIFIYKKEVPYKKVLYCKEDIQKKVLDFKNFMNKVQYMKEGGSKKQNEIFVMRKNKIFNKIFLYEKINDHIIIYPVKWLDVITN